MKAFVTGFAHVFVYCGYTASGAGMLVANQHYHFVPSAGSRWVGDTNASWSITHSIYSYDPWYLQPTGNYAYYAPANGLLTPPLTGWLIFPGFGVQPPPTLTEDTSCIDYGTKLPR